MTLNIRYRLLNQAKKVDLFDLMPDEPLAPLPRRHALRIKRFRGYSGTTKPAAFNVGLRQPGTVRVNLACGSSQVSQFVISITGSRGKVNRLAVFGDAAINTAFLAVCHVGQCHRARQQKTHYA